MTKLYGPQPKHSFPTRRSSDLNGETQGGKQSRRHRVAPRQGRVRGAESLRSHVDHFDGEGALFARGPPLDAARRGGRSEEHTSELQSHSDLVCRLLLEKKNNHY